MVLRHTFTRPRADTDHTVNHIHVRFAIINRLCNLGRLRLCPGNWNDAVHRYIPAQYTIQGIFVFTLYNITRRWIHLLLYCIIHDNLRFLSRLLYWIQIPENLVTYYYVITYVLKCLNVQVTLTTYKYTDHVQGTLTMYNYIDRVQGTLITYNVYWPRIRYITYHVKCTMYENCTLYTVQCTMHENCTLYTVQCTMHEICTLYTVQCTAYTAYTWPPRTPYSVLGRLYTMLKLYIE